MTYISLQTAIILTGCSLSTLKRRIADGSLQSVNNPMDRNKIMVCLDTLKDSIGVPIDPDDLDFIKSADEGDAYSQNYLAILFLENDQPKRAIYWLELSTKQGLADSMQLLGDCYLHGNGVSKDHNLALMWIAKAASAGHPIADAQIKGLRPNAINLILHPSKKI
jgi:TPR repeat protein